MTAIQWANRVRCDWPDCPNEAEIVLTDHWPSMRYPEGWTSGRPNLNLMLASDGRTVNDFCPEHSAKTVAELVDAYPVRNIEVPA